MRRIIKSIQTVLFCGLFIAPVVGFAQSKPLREIKVGYPLGGSSSYFWVAYRSGSFEKHGLKLEPIYIRGGLLGIQAALAGISPEPLVLEKPVDYPALRSSLLSSLRPRSTSEIVSIRGDAGHTASQAGRNRR